MAQYLNTGDDPGNIKWKQIKTNDYQIIFPEGYEENAKKIANTLSFLYVSGSRTLDHYPKKISVILHTHTSVSNGMVSWAPRRIELYSNPNQTMSPMDWFDQLIVHEFRHVVQMDKIDSEMPRLIRFLFGEHSAALIAGLYLPFWFLEGDAVVTETLLTHSGRGRLPSFLMLTKAQVLENGLYSFEKATLGSYKDFVPNRYHFGYWFLSESRRQYGDKLWADVVRNIAKRPLSITPMNKIIREKTNFTKNKLYKSVFNSLSESWQKEQNNNIISNYEPVSPKLRGYNSYLYTHAMPDSSFIALKKSRKDIDRIVKVNNSKEKVLFTPGQVTEESFSITKNYSIRAEVKPHARWTHSSSSRIIVQNLVDKKKINYYYPTFLSSPVISPNFKYFAAVENDINNQYRLSVFDLKTGKYVKCFRTKNNHYFTTLEWNSSSDTIFFVGISKDGNYLAQVDINSGKIERLTQTSFHNIKNPMYKNGHIYYVSAQTGIDNIFCLNLKNGNVQQVTSVKYGADYPTINNDMLYFSNYTEKGFEVAKMRISDSSNIMQDTVHYHLVEDVSLQEDGVYNFKNVPDKNYKIKPYSKFNLFNFHSWGPVYVDADNYEIKPGVSLLSQNKLGTATSQFGYIYDPSNQTDEFVGKFRYSGLFPIFSATVGYGKEKTNIWVVNQEKDTLLKKINWHELSTEFNISIPLTFNRGKYNFSILPEIGYNYLKIYHGPDTPQSYNYRGHYHSLNYRLLLYNRIKMSEFDLIPDWGQSLEIIYKHNPLNNSGMSVNSLLAFKSNLFFPGLAPNHGLRIYNGYQVKEKNNFLTYNNEVRFPRGISAINNYELFTSGIDYMMPLMYPDLNIPGLYYLKRIRSSFFCDFTKVKSQVYNTNGAISSITNNLNSFGVELIADGHFLRLPAPVATGLRTIYLSEKQEFRFEFLLTINFNAL